MRYNVGDKVRVQSLEYFKKNFKKVSWDGGSFQGPDNTFTSEMQELCGKIVTIKKICKKIYYNIENGGFNWHDWMFVPPIEEMMELLEE